MRAITTKLPAKTLINHLLPSLSLSSHNLSTSADSTRPKLDRIANELLSLNPVELHDYTILLPMKLGLKNSALSSLSSAAGPSGSAQPAAQEEPKEKTMFDVKLEKFDAGAKIKIIKEVRSFTDLGLKEAKELVEKTPGFLKKGVTKDEGDAIVEKLKALGATVVLE